MEKKRLQFLDMVKGIAIILVIIGHIEYVPAPVRIWISCFHMPVFFVVSGILIAVKNETEYDTKTIIGKKWRGIMIPYMWFSLSFFLIDIGNVCLNKIDIHTFIVNTISAVTFYGKSVLWFLPAIFLAQLYFILIKKNLKKYIWLIAVVMLTAIAYFCKLGLDSLYASYSDSLLITSVINFMRTFVRAAIATPFVAFGYLVYVGLSKIDSGKIGIRIVCVFAGMAVLIGVYPLAMYNGCVDLHNIILANVAVYYISAFAASLAMIVMCIGLPVIRPITYFGRNSLIVMADHLDYYILWAGIVLSMKILSIVGISNQWLFLLLIVLIVLLLSIIVIEGINRFFPFVLGKKTKEKK